MDMRNLAASLTLLCAASVFAQQVDPNHVRVTAVSVTDPLNRFVNGLDEEHFTIIVNGITRPLVTFADPESAISIAVVSNSPVSSIVDLLGAEDELIQTTSLTEAVRRLTVSRAPRKALIRIASTDTASIAPGIQFVQADFGNLRKIVIELRNEYFVTFVAEPPAADVQVALKQPRNLPVLKVAWQTPF